MRRNVILLGSFFLLSLCLAVSVSTVSAHASVLRSFPENNELLEKAPAEVQIWYTEPIAPEFSGAKLFNAEGDEIPIPRILRDSGDPSLLTLVLPDNLEPGLFSVRWRTLSETDGHFTQGLLVFGFGEGLTFKSAPVAAVETEPSAVEILLRWINFGALSLLVGAIAIYRFVLFPNNVPALTGLSARWAGRIRSRLLLWAVISGITYGIISIGLPLWQGYALQETFFETGPNLHLILQVIKSTRWGVLGLVRWVLGLLAVSLIIRVYLETRARQDHEFTGDGARSFTWFWIGLLLLTLLVLQALTGHSAAVEPHQWLALYADILHLFAACLWVGGLMAVLVSFHAAGPTTSAELLVLIRSCWRPFSRYAALSVGILLATGLYSTALHVASIDALIATLYGQALIGKIGLLIVMGLMGLGNALVLNPVLSRKLAHLLRWPPDWTPWPTRSLPSMAAFEVVLGVVAFLAVGIITSLQQPKGVAYRPQTKAVPNSLSQTSEDMLITLGISPNVPGPNIFTVWAASTRRPPPAEILRVILRFSYLDETFERVSADAEMIEPGLYQLGGSFMNLPGTWLVEVVIRRNGIEDQVGRFVWNVKSQHQGSERIISDRPLEPSLAWAGLLLAAIILVASTIVWLVNRRANGS